MKSMKKFFVCGLIGISMLSFYPGKQVKAISVNDVVITRGGASREVRSQDGAGRLWGWYNGTTFTPNYDVIYPVSNQMNWNVNITITAIKNILEAGANVISVGDIDRYVKRNGEILTPYSQDSKIPSVSMQSVNSIFDKGNISYTSNVNLKPVYDSITGVLVGTYNKVEKKFFPRRLPGPEYQPNSPFFYNTIENNLATGTLVNNSYFSIPYTTYVRSWNQNGKIDMPYSFENIK